MSEDQKVKHNTEKAFQKMFLHSSAVFLQNKFLLFTIYGIIFSYFYNLPVIKYSVTGDNEFRIYDVLGVFILYYYFKYFPLVNFVIKKVLIFKLLRRFMIWACITMILTLSFHIIYDRLLSFLQVLLYMYHFWVFYLTAVFFYIFCLDKKNTKNIIYYILVLSIASCVVIILQNLGFINFLWSESYKIAYEGFLSGTLGPNKIVAGMTSLFVLSLCFGLLIEKNYSINKLFVFFVLFINIYIIIVSGSRTTYVGLIIIGLFFALKSPLRFVISVSVLSFLFVFALTNNPALQKSLDDTLEKRIFRKTKVFENEDAEITDAYEDLGAGRDKLTKNNFNYLLENPMIIPFGSGFVNHFNKKYGKSAHNMYLQSIRETGLVGFFLYFGWLVSYLFIRFDRFNGFSLALQSLIYAMLVTLFFGEHLYIYRPLFGLLGLFLMITTIFVSSLHKIEIRTI